MSQYLLSMHVVEGEVREPMTPETMQEFMEKVNALEAEMRESGAFVFTGGLHGPDAATVVRMSDGDLVMTDGPFAESKELVAGYSMVEAPDLAAAISLAQGSPMPKSGGTVEVRELANVGKQEE